MFPDEVRTGHSLFRRRRRSFGGSNVDSGPGEEGESRQERKDETE